MLFELGLDDLSYNRCRLGESMVKLPFISAGSVRKLELGAVRFNKQGMMHKFE